MTGEAFSKFDWQKLQENNQPPRQPQGNKGKGSGKERSTGMSPMGNQRGQLSKAMQTDLEPSCNSRQERDHRLSWCGLSVVSGGVAATLLAPLKRSPISINLFTGKGSLPRLRLTWMRRSTRTRPVKTVRAVLLVGLLQTISGPMASLPTMVARVRCFWSTT